MRRWSAGNAARHLRPDNCCVVTTIVFFSAFLLVFAQLEFGLLQQLEKLSGLPRVSKPICHVGNQTHEQ
jgi:hypothetical protein